MSDASSADAPKPTGAAAKAEQDAEAVEKFTLDELRRSARSLFGVSKHVVAGALVLEKKTAWTVEEAERKIKAFVSRPVEQSGHAKAQGRTV